MIYLLWLLPALLVAAAIGSGRLGTTHAALLGLLAALPVAMFAGPLAPGGGQLTQALVRGSWIAATIAPYILGGILFWQVAAPSSRPPPAGPSFAASSGSAHARSRAERRLLFFACFLVGPFAESVTGFGVGMLGTVALIHHLRIAPRHLMVFALMSQTLIPWGGMGSGTLLAAAYARLPPAELGLYAVIPTGLLMLIWLPLFWRTAAAAGFPSSRRECVREVAWTLMGLGLLATATFHLGPEAAMLTAYGSLIVFYHLYDQRPSRAQALATLRQMLPFGLLIGGLALTRLLPGLRTILAELGRWAPFDDLPAWAPLYHAGSWLVSCALLTLLWRQRWHQLGQQARSAWATGRQAVMAVFLFAMLAEVLSAGGIPQALAAGLFAGLHSGALLLAPLLAGTFGILANTGNAPNSLFLPSQLALAAQAGLSVPAVAALLHVSGTSMSLFSPVRMSIAASLVRGQGQERAVYGLLLPYGFFGFVLLTLMALAIVVIGAAPGDGWR